MESTCSCMISKTWKFGKFIGITVYVYIVFFTRLKIVSWIKNYYELKMDEHQVKLDTVCRVCKSIIVTDSKYRVPKNVEIYSDIIQKCNNYNVISDCAKVHPKLLCRLCDSKLYKLKKKIRS